MIRIPELADPLVVKALAAIACSVVALIVAAAWLSERDGTERRLAGRIAALAQAASAPAQRRARRLDAAALLRAIGEALGSTALISARDRRELERSVAAAGLKPGSVVPALIGLKVVLLLLVPLAFWAFTALRGIGGVQQIATVAAGVLIGLLGPNWVLGWMHARHVRQIRTGLPDTLDLMVICAEAGLGLESMVERVAIEMAPSNGPIAAEFATLSNELRLLSDRRQALLNIGQRTDVEGLRRLSTTLAQTLRALASEMRQERLTAFEERAAKLPAILVLPLTLFILPCLVLLLAGPSFVQLIGAFKS
jgi:tight adherence protein C